MSLASLRSGESVSEHPRDVRQVERPMNSPRFTTLRLPAFTPRGSPSESFELRHLGGRWWQWRTGQGAVVWVVGAHAC